MANLIMRFPGGLPKALTLSYDDGVEQDEKLIEIAEEYGLKGTFNINSGCFPPEDVTYAPGTIHRRMPLNRLKAAYAKSSWEIAAQVVRGFAYPYGAYDEQTVGILKSCGIAYARTVNATHDFHLPKDWLRLEATCHHNDPELMKLAKRFVETKDWWDPMLFYLWGHSYEFEARDNWEVIEEFARTVSGKDDIWYATNIEIHDYCEAFSRLRFNTAMTVCVNPAASDLWFACGEKEVHVPAGQTVTF